MGGGILVTTTLSGFRTQSSTTEGKMRFLLDGVAGPLFQVTSDQKVSDSSQWQHSGSTFVYLFTNVSAGNHEIGVQVQNFSVRGSESLKGNSFLMASEL